MRRMAIINRILFITLFIANTPSFSTETAVWEQFSEGEKIKVDHSAWQQLLDGNLDEQHPSGINRFDYAAVDDNDGAKLNEYLDYLQGLAPKQLSKDQQFAYWVNLYNATTVKFILDEEDEIESIRQIRSGFFKPGPWQRKVLNIGGNELSLDDIEHKILRPIWQDMRIHYAVNCASLGCPNLLGTAFTAVNLEALLEQAASDYINHPRGVSVDNDRLQLSKIFQWYSDDFGDDFVALKGHLSQYAKPLLRSKLQEFKSASYKYDWRLNRP